MKTHIPHLLVMLGWLAGIHLATAQVLTNIVVSPASPVIVAGSNQQFTATKQYDDGSARAFRPGDWGGSWVEVAGMPSAKCGAAMAAVNGELLVVGGGDAIVYAYNPASDTWTIKAPFANPWCAYSGAAGIGNTLYLMGGCESGNCSFTTSGLTVYDAVANSWSNATPMNTARSLMAAAVLDGRIYVAGGDIGNNGIISSLEVYDPATNGWAFKSPMPTARRECGAAAINGLLYVVGGWNGATVLGTLEVYDPANDTWTTKASMPTPQSGLGVTAVGGLLYAINGVVEAGGTTNLAQVYDPTTDTWSTGAPTLTAFYLPRPVAIGGTIYVTGGCGPNGNSITNVEAYTPPRDFWSSSSPTVVSIDTNGVALGLTDGVTTITARSGSISGSTRLTVVTVPTISTQPTNITAATGGSVTLSAIATGGNLSYQWAFNGTNIAGATGASLTITNLSLANVGQYTVTVANLAGSVTSLAATLASVDIKMFAGIIVNGPLGAKYVIQAASDLSRAWTTLTNVALPTQPYIYIDYGSPQSARRFYRAFPLSAAENFSDNAKDASKWGDDIMLGAAGQLEETNGRLEFHSTGLDSQAAIRSWTAGYGSYTNDWEVWADLNLGNVNLAINGSHVEMFLGVFNTGDMTNGFGRDQFALSLDLYRNDSGISSRTFTPYFRVDAVEVGSGDAFAQPASAQSVAVRITFDSLTKTLTGWYDADGSANGYAWTLLRSVQINQPGSNWEMNAASRFQFGLGGGSEGFVVNSSHAVFADNLWVMNAVGRDTPPAPPGMALIPAGSFQMGDTFSETGLDHELPVHPVYVSAFYMDKYDVTKALWDEVCHWATNHGYSFEEAGLGKAATHPVQYVSWYDCVKWCNARSEKEGRVPAYYTTAEQATVYRTGRFDVQNNWVKWASGYRLPTEAEWEKAARGGTNGQRFPWGNTISWSQANYYSYWSGGHPYYTYDVNPAIGYDPAFNDGVYPNTSPVGYFAPNGYGLYDMGGNVWQWCWDWYGSYSSGSQTDPRGPASGFGRVNRGGSCYADAYLCRAAFRRDDYFGPDVGEDLGFRSVLALGQ